MNETVRLTTVSDVIAAFGGPNAMASVFGGVPSRFCNARAKGAFPASMHMQIYVQCLKRGLTIAPELVGMTSEIMARANADAAGKLAQMTAE